jgi:hypothetical protein
VPVEFAISEEQNTALTAPSTISEEELFSVPQHCDQGQDIKTGMFSGVKVFRDPR